MERGAKELRDYIPKSGKIEKEIYMQVKYRLKRYPKIKTELNNLNLRGQALLNRKEKKRFKMLVKEISAIESACGEMLARYSCYADKEFEPIGAYFSYEQYNLHIKRSGNPDDLGASQKKWAEFKREFTEVLREKLGIV